MNIIGIHASKGEVELHLLLIENVFALVLMGFSIKDKHFNLIDFDVRRNIRIVKNIVLFKT